MNVETELSSYVVTDYHYKLVSLIAATLSLTGYSFSDEDTYMSTAMQSCMSESIRLRYICAAIRENNIENVEIAVILIYFMFLF